MSRTRKSKMELPTLGGKSDVFEGKDDVRGARYQHEKARHLAEKGKGAKTIVRKTGIRYEDARRIVRAYRESRVRKSRKEILNDMLAGSREMLAKAHRDFIAGNKGATYAVQVASAEQRAILDQLAKEDRPEEMALIIIQEILQGMLKGIAQDVVTESNRSMNSILKVASNPAQREEVENAFKAYVREIGKMIHERYGLASTRVCTTLKCDIEDVKKLASESSSDSLAVEVGDNVIPLKKRG